MIEMGKDSRTVVIATDEHEDGTNALLMRPPGLIPYEDTGPGGYRRHVMAAHRKGAHLKVLYLCSEQAAFVNGAVLSIDGGWTAA